MAIPEGYRLLTKDDVGKVFGTDLELEVYIDNTVQPSFYSPDDYGSTTINLTNFIELIIGYGYPPYDDFTSTEENTIRFNQSVIRVDWINSSAFGYNVEWVITDYTFTENVEITSYNTDSDWNNFFYVKDKSDPYNIKLTEPKLTIHCEEQTMKKDIVVQTDVYDGTVEGGEVVEGGGSSGTTDSGIDFEPENIGTILIKSTNSNGLANLNISTDYGKTWQTGFTPYEDPYGTTKVVIDISTDGMKALRLWQASDRFSNYGVLFIKSHTEITNVVALNSTTIVTEIYNIGVIGTNQYMILIEPSETECTLTITFGSGGGSD